MKHLLLIQLNLLSITNLSIIVISDFCLSKYLNHTQKCSVLSHLGSNNIFRKAARALESLVECQHRQIHHRELRACTFPPPTHALHKHDEEPLARCPLRDKIQENITSTLFKLSLMLSGQNNNQEKSILCCPHIDV